MNYVKKRSKWSGNELKGIKPMFEKIKNLFGLTYNPYLISFITCSNDMPHFYHTSCLIRGKVTLQKLDHICETIANHAAIDNVSIINVTPLEHKNDSTK